MNAKEISRILKKYIDDNDENYFYVLSTNDNADIKVTHKNTHNKLIHFLNDELKIDLNTCLIIDRNIEKILEKIEEE